MHMTRVNTAVNPDGFWLLREQRRYRFVAEKLRQAGLSACAELCDGWADQARLEAHALQAVDDRMAALTTY